MEEIKVGRGTKRKKEWVGRFIQATYFVANWKGKTSSLLSTVKPPSHNRGPDGTITVWIKESSQPPQMINISPTLLLSPLYISLDPREVMGKLAKWAKGEPACESLSMKRLKSWRWSLCFFIHIIIILKAGVSQSMTRRMDSTLPLTYCTHALFLSAKTNKYVMKDYHTDF